MLLLFARDSASCRGNISWGPEAGIDESRENLSFEVSESAGVTGALYGFGLLVGGKILASTSG